MDLWPAGLATAHRLRENGLPEIFHTAHASDLWMAPESAK
jgi:hypothetical protein